MSTAKDLRFPAVTMSRRYEAAFPPVKRAGRVLPGSARGKGASFRGKYYRSRTPAPGQTWKDVAVDATIRRYALRLASWTYGAKLCRYTIHEGDLMVKVRRHRPRLVVAFVVDNSFSMYAAGFLPLIASALGSMFSGTLRRGDRVALVAFAGIRSPRGVVCYGPGRNIRRASEVVAKLPVVGRTPLPSAIVRALRLLQTEIIRNGKAFPAMVVLSDFRPNVGLVGRSAPAEDLVRCGMLARRTKVRVATVCPDRQSSPLELAFVKACSSPGQRGQS